MASSTSPRVDGSIFFPTTGVLSNRGGHGIQPEIVIEELTAAGFVLDRRIDAWRGGNYCLVFRRPEHEPVKSALDILPQRRRLEF